MQGQENKITDNMVLTNLRLFSFYTQKHSLTQTWNIYF